MSDVVLEIPERDFSEIENMPRDYRDVDPLQGRCSDSRIEDIFGDHIRSSNLVLDPQVKSGRYKNFGMCLPEYSIPGLYLLASREPEDNLYDLPRKGSGIGLLLMENGHSILLQTPRTYSDEYVKRVLINPFMEELRKNNLIPEYRHN